MTYEAQLQTYRAHLPELLAQHLGRYALVYRGEVSAYETTDQARAAGFEKCGRVSGFLIKLIIPEGIPN